MTTKTETVSRADRRRIVSPWFKRQIVARLILACLVVFAAVCFAFGAVGIGVGAVILAGVAVVAYVQRRRRWRAAERQMWE